MTDRQRGKLFPSTRWTLIRRAQGDEHSRKRALDELLCIYLWTGANERQLEQMVTGQPGHACETCM